MPTIAPAVGRLLLGIEDDRSDPPADQRIPSDLPGTLRRKLSERTAILQRVGGEIHPKQVKRALDDLIERGEARFEGNKRWRRYWAAV